MSTMKKIAAAVVLATAAMGAQAAPLAIDTMYAATGSFNLGGMPGTPGSWTFSGAAMDLTAANNQAYGSSFTFFGGPVFAFSSDSTYAPYGGAAVVGGPTINGTVDAATNSITVDLSNWTAHWNGTNFNQGASSVTGTWNSGTGAFNIAWASTVVGGPFNGQTGNWTLQGTAAAVPEAETYAMMLAGLGLIGTMVGRRRKTLG